MCALSCLDCGLVGDLCHVLLRQFPDDAWIVMHFASRRTLERDVNPGIIPFENLELSFWYSAGYAEECRVCGYRPQKLFRQRITQATSKLVALLPYHCESCKYMGMKLGLLERNVHLMNFSRYFHRIM